MKYRDIGGVEGLLEAYSNGERNFSQIKLKNANLSQANLPGINLSQANLRGANLAYANLSEADFQGADLTGSNLRRANLTRSNLQQTILEGVDFYLANLSWCNLSDRNLSTVNLTRVDLQGANLSNTNLSKANLTEAKLDRANLTDANLTAAKLDRAYLPYAQLSQTNLQEAELTGADLTGANLERSNLDKVNLGRARLRKANLYRASLQQAYLQDCQLQMVNFTEANLQKANLNDAKCEHANFTKTDLRGVEVHLAKDANLELAITSNLDLGIQLSLFSKGIQQSLFLELEACGDSLAFSSNSEILAYCGHYHETNLTVINISTQKKLIEIDIQPEPKILVVYKKDGSPLYQLVYINDLKVWNYSTGKLINNLKSHSTVATGKPYPTFGIGDETDELYYYYKPTIAFTQTNSVQNPVLVTTYLCGLLKYSRGGSSSSAGHVSISTDKKVLAKKYEDGPVQIWDLHEGKELATLNLDSESDCLLALNPTGNILAVRRNKAEIGIWDIKASTLIQKITGHSDYINVIVFSPDGRTLATGSDDRTIKLWNLETGQELTTFRDYSPILSLAFHPIEPILAAGSYGGHITIFDLEKLENIHTFQPTFRTSKCSMPRLRFLRRLAIAKTKNIKHKCSINRQSPQRKNATWGATK